MFFWQHGSRFRKAKGGGVVVVVVGGSLAKECRLSDGNGGVGYVYVSVGVLYWRQGWEGSDYATGLLVAGLGQS